MSANCLVAKLKSSVSDDGTLRKLGEIVVFVNEIENPDYSTGGNSTQFISVQSNYPPIVTFNCLDGGTFCDSSGVPTETSKTTPDLRVFLKNGGNWRVSITEKYRIHTIKLPKKTASLNINDFHDCNELGYVNIANASNQERKTTGDLYYIKDCPITQLYLANTLVTGDIKNLPLTIGVCSIGESQIYGDIKDLGKHISLSTITCTTLPNLSGSLESLAESQIANGRTDGTLTVSGLYSNITFNGQIVTKSYTITFENGTYSIA